MPRSITSYLKNKDLQSTIIYALKLSLGLGLFIYFLTNDKLNFDLRTGNHYITGFSVLFLIQILIFFITNYRWFVITKTLNLQSLSYKECLFFSWVGQFFTTFLPAFISSDLSKLHYLRQRGYDTKGLIQSIIIDRIVSAISILILFCISVTAIIWKLPIFVFCTLLALSGFFYNFLRLKFKHLPGKLINGVSLPPVITIFISFISFPLKALSLFYIIALAGHLFNLELFYLSLAGQLFEVFPLTPANLGVGHLTFDYLYSTVHVINGAQIYNFYFMVKLLFKLSGVVGWFLVAPLWDWEKNHRL